MASLRPSMTSGGNDVTVTSDTAVSFADYQSVTSHGNETVSDAASPTIVTYSPGQAVLKRNGASTSGKVHIPVHNPPNLLMSQKFDLESILISFDVAGSNAVVNTVTLYYDTTMVVSVNPYSNGTFHVDFTGTEPGKYAYVPPSGICVTLDLKFPDANSVVNLYSVTVIYKAA